MKRKVNDKLLWIAVLMVALSLILQAFAMKSILKQPTLGQYYENGGFVDKNLLDGVRIPISKEILDAQFLKYKYVSDYGQTLNLFTTQQCAEFLAKREHGLRNPLTIDEVLYIIEDSIDVYFTYQQTVLTGERAQAGSVGGALFYSVGFPKSYDTYEELHAQVVSDISQIIWFRLMTHDAGFVQVVDQSEWGSGEFVVLGKKDLNLEDYAENYVLLLDENTAVDDIYKNDVAIDFYSFWINWSDADIKESSDFDSISISRPAVYLNTSRNEVIMWDTRTHDAVKVFPAASLESRINEKLENQ